MNVEGTNYNVTFEKISLREDAHDIVGEAPDGVIKYNVKLGVVVGDLLF